MVGTHAAFRRRGICNTNKSQTNLSRISFRKHFFAPRISWYGEGMKRFIFFGGILGMVAVSGAMTLFLSKTGSAMVPIYPKPEASFWVFRSIDTMKHSRDLAREKLNDASYDAVIDREVRQIAETGASHIAIATPYDDEFVPYLSRWVASARRHGLGIWFRGNFSGWEEWFGYARISPQDHLAKTRSFIERHADLFQDGDAFSSCPECENGGPGDPRQTGDVSGYREFLIAEYEATKSSFSLIGKRVTPNLFSMNGDVARLVMDKDTTEKLGGIVTVDHYVKTPETLARDAEGFLSKSGGQLFLGEFGAPIPDIHGSMNEAAQARWLWETLSKLSRIHGVSGLNYWTHVGSSTALWDEKGTAREAARVLSGFYSPRVFYGVVSDELGMPIRDACVSIGDDEVRTNGEGYFELRVPRVADERLALSVSASAFLPQEFPAEESQMGVILERAHETLWFKLKKWVRQHVRVTE